MYDKYEMWVEEYVIFTLQLPPSGGALPPAVIVKFNSWEIYEVEQNDGTDIELWTSEIGTSNSVVKRNGLSFAFNVDANFSPETRKKVQQMFYYMSKGCQLSFVFNKYRSLLPDFPHGEPTHTPTDLHNPAVLLPYACISLLSKAIDSTHDGMGVLYGENSTVSFVVKEAVDPLELTPCKRLSMLDFSLSDWILEPDGNGDYYIYNIIIEADSGGLIERFLNHPDGVLSTIPPTSTAPITFLSINPAGNVMLYTDDLMNVVNSGVYQLVIPNIKVKLKTGETCEITFTQQVTITI